MELEIKVGRPRTRPDSRTLEALAGLKREDVARLYDVNPATVRSWYHRDKKERELAYGGK